MTKQLNLTNLASAPKHSRADAAKVAVAGWVARAFNRWQRNKMISIMHGFDDRLLADIGVKRGEIAQAVDGILNEGRRAKQIEIDNAKLAQSEEQPKMAA